MHAGLRAVYYTYKMLLSTFRSRLAPRVELAPDPRAWPAAASEEVHHGSQRA
jgi:hypothetical protein